MPGTAHLRNERNIAGARPASVSAEKLLRIASLLAGAAVGTDGALVFSDGRAPLPNPVILEGSIGELAERLARLGVLHCVAD